LESIIEMARRSEVRPSEMTLREVYVKFGYVNNQRQLTDYIELVKDSCERIDGSSDLRRQLEAIVHAHGSRLTDLFPGGSQAICVENALDKRRLFKQGAYDHEENGLEPNGRQIFLVYRVRKDNVLNLGSKPGSPVHTNDRGQVWRATGNGEYYCIDYDQRLWNHDWAYEKYRAVALALLGVCIGGIETGLDLLQTAPCAKSALDHLRRNARLFVQLVQSEADPLQPPKQSRFVREIGLDESKLSDRLCLLITKIAEQSRAEQPLDDLKFRQMQDELNWICSRLRLHSCFQQAAMKSKLNRRAIIDGMEWREYEMLYFPRAGALYYTNPVRCSLTN
jgi:hypothetical protein